MLHPLLTLFCMIDLMAAHQLKEGVLLALMHRMKTGEGSYVVASLFEAAVASLANQATNWLMTGNIPQRMGTQHPNIAPYGDLLVCKDEKPIVLAVGTEKQFSELCQCLGKPSLANDERFKTNAQRVVYRSELIEILTPLFKNFNLKYILEVFEQPLAQNMILEEQLPDGSISKRVKTVVFTIDTM